MAKETRTIRQVKVYKLVLNPMTANFERVNVAALAFDKDKLLDWYQEQKADEKYQDGNWSKTFKKDSPLELYNDIDYGDHCGIFHEWLNDEEDIRRWVQDAKNSYGFITVPELIDIDV